METLREMIFRPYAGQLGDQDTPAFHLIMTTDGSVDERGCERVSYELRALYTIYPPRIIDATPHSDLLFAGNDFYGSPLHASDSDESTAALMSFLTARPGDTDEEYFENYTSEQIEYCEQHAEALNAEVMYVLGKY